MGTTDCGFDKSGNTKGILRFMDTYITGFIPWDKTYCFSFDKYNCYLRRKGICSLQNMHLPSDFKKCKKYEKWQKMFCPNLASSILQQGFVQAADNVKVIKNACGHYCVDEGQHRICVCARLKVPMKILYKESDEKCIICSMHGIRKKLSYMLGREEDILIKL